jgi:hypothetical protein
MATNTWLKTCWQGCCLCGRGFCRLVRWCLWLGLIIAAGVQVTILTSQRLQVPDFVLREIASNLGAAGLAAEFGEVALDPSGRLLLQDMELSLAGINTPIMRARAVYLEIDPWALWWREIDPQLIRFSGVDLLIPAALSPTGRSEAIIEGIDATLRSTDIRGQIALDQLTAQFGPVPVTMRGGIQLPNLPTETSEPWDQLMAKFSANYLSICRQAGRILPHLQRLESLRLDLHLEPRTEGFAQVSLDAFAAELEVTLPAPSTPALALHELHLQTSFELGATRQKLPLIVRLGRVTGPNQIALEHVQGWTSATITALPLTAVFGDLRISADQLTHPIASLSALTATTNLETLPVLPTQLTARFGGEAWSVISDWDVTTAAGKIEVAGHVGSPVLEVAAAQLGFDVPSILKWESAPYLTSTLNLGAGAQPLRAEAYFSTQAVEARWVPLTATSARVRWTGTDLWADQILLRTGPSVATGSYHMDTASLDFSFLLRGQLEPPSINGWFRDWWGRLFDQFDFTGGLPQASVEVSGRWGAPLETRVFVAADATDPVVREIPMQRMRTRLFTRPGWADVQHFLVERPMGDVEGAFLRAWRMPDSRRWTRVEIHAGGVTDLSPTPKLLRRTGDAMIAPFDFAEPLQLRLDGSAVREDWGMPVTESFQIRGSAEGPWAFKGFPFDGVTFAAEQQNDRILIDTFQAGMSGGVIDGRIELQGEPDERQVAFDLNLAEASLGQTIHDTNVWLAERRGETAGDATDFEKQMADGKLNIALTAEGPSDNLLGLKGRGSAAIADANFSNINLLGVLSTLLERTILNFSTLQLSHANADFVLEGSQLNFEQIKATGSRGAVNATGAYSLADRSLNFNTRVRPFEGGEGLLDAVFTPFTSALEVKLGGHLGEPEWTFVYGPTNLLRNLTGENARNRAAAPSEPAPPPPTKAERSPPEREAPPAPVSAETETPAQ